MRSNIYILSKDRPNVTRALSEKFFINQEINSRVLDRETLEVIANTCTTEFFYVISSDYDFEIKNFDFKFKPEPWDQQFMHIWNLDSKIKLLHRDSVLADPDHYTDAALESGITKIKNIDVSITEQPRYDVIFLSYDEYDADNRFRQLLSRHPGAKRVHGVKGIVEAHQAAAKVAATNFFYVVDADAELVDDFEFNTSVHESDFCSVHVWKSINPVNGLEYGYGGVKLFPRQPVISFNGHPADFTTTVSGSLKVMERVSNITKFNTDPFSAWRSGFREAVKLSAGLIKNEDSDTRDRLETWCTVGNDAEFGDFTIAGACEGRQFGTEHFGDPKMLRLINDYRWLEEKFSSG